MNECVTSGRISVVASFRDPRDIALSMLDAGQIERNAGISRFFYRFEKIEQVIGPIKRNSRNLSVLSRLPNVCLIPFHLIANDFPFAVGMITDYLGAGHLQDQVYGEVSGQISDLPEFNKGIADRFVTDLSDEDLRIVCESLKEEAALYDLCFRDVFQRYGRLKQAEEIIAERDAKIAARLQRPSGSLGKVTVDPDSSRQIAMELLQGQSLDFSRLLAEVSGVDREVAAKNLCTVRDYIQAQSPSQLAMALSLPLAVLGDRLGRKKLGQPARVKFLVSALNLAIGVMDGSATDDDLQAFASAMAGAFFAARREGVTFVISNVQSIDALKRLLGALDFSDGATWDAVCKAAKAFEAAGDPLSAAHCWEALALSDTTQVGAYLGAVRNWVAIGEIKQAQLISKRLVPSEARSDALVSMAKAMRLCGKYDDALEAVSEAVRRVDGGTLTLTPQNWRPLVNQLVMGGDFKSADRISPKAMVADQVARCVIFDPGHTDGPGHHAIYNHFFADVLEELTGEPPEIIVGRQYSGISLEGRRVRKSTLFAPYVDPKDLIDPRSVEGTNRFLKGELDSLFENGVPDVLVLHSLYGRMLPGLVNWLKDLGQARPRVLILGFLNADQPLLASLEVAFPGMVADTFKALSEVSGADSILFAETSATIDWLGSEAPSIPVEKFPYLPSERMMRLPRRDVDHPTFGILGGTRQERGIGTILQAIEIAPDDTRWLVQVDGEVVSRWNNGAHDRLERLRAADRAQVEFLDGMLPGTGYEDAFARLDVLVLPYTAEYGMRGSGVLWEAIHGRKALILSMESGLCSELDAVGYPYLGIPAGDPQAIAKAVAEMSETWPGTKAAIAAFHQSQPQLPADVFRSLLSERLSKLDLARDGHRRHRSTVRSANMRSR